MKKILIYILTIFMMFMGISNAKAYYLGECRYVKDDDNRKTATITVTTDSAKIAFATSNFSLSGDQLTRVKTNGECYEYVFIDTKGINHYTLTDDGTDNEANNPESGARYTLSKKANSNCVYEVSKDGYKGYLFLNQNANSAYPKMSFGTNKSSPSKQLDNYNSTLFNFSDGSNNKSYMFHPSYLYETQYYDAQASNQNYGLDGEMTTGCPILRYAIKGNEVAIAYQHAMLVSLGATDSEITEILANSFDLPKASTSDNPCSFNLAFNDDSVNGTVKFEKINSKLNISLTIGGNTKTIAYDPNIVNDSYAGGNEIIMDAGTGDISFKFGHDMLAKINSNNYTCDGLKSSVKAYSDTDLKYETIYRSLYLITDSITNDAKDFKWVSEDANSSDNDYVNNVVERAKEREKDIEGEDVKGCEGLIGENTLKLLNLALNFLMIIGPIIALVLGTYDLVMAMASGEDDAKKKGIKKMKDRLIASALLLLVPYIIKLILNIAGRGGTDCINAMQNLSIYRSNF